MRNEIAKPTFISLVALLSFGILRKKMKINWESETFETFITLKNCFDKYIAFFVQQGEWLKRKSENDLIVLKTTAHQQSNAAPHNNWPKLFLAHTLCLFQKKIISESLFIRR